MLLLLSFFSYHLQSLELGHASSRVLFQGLYSVIFGCIHSPMCSVTMPGSDAYEVSIMHHKKIILSGTSKVARSVEILVTQS